MLPPRSFPSLPLVKTNWPAHLALFAVAVIYGANYSIAKVVLAGDYIGPLGFILARVLTATALFWMTGLWRPTPAIPRKDMGRLVLCGLFGVASNQLLFFSGLDRTTPIHASLIMVLTPVLVLLLSALIERRGIRKERAFGVVLAGIGAIILILQGRHQGLSDGDVLGDLMVAGNATSYALYLILVRPLMAKYQPNLVLKWVFLFGTFFVMFFGWPQALEARWEDFTPLIILCFVYVLIFTTFFAYGLNAFALQRVAPVTVSAYIYLQPLIAAFIALLIGQETLTMPKILSAVLIFMGVYLVSIERKPISS